MRRHLPSRASYHLGVVTALAAALGVGPPPAVAATLTAPSIPVTAITAEGAAVYLTAHGDQVHLMDDDLTTSVLHSVAVTADGRRAWVTACCEPVWGQWWEIAVGQGPVDPYGRAGYAFDLDPDGLRLLSLGFFAVAVRDLDGQIVAHEDLADDADPRDAYDAMWVDDGRAAVLELVQPAAGDEFRLVTTDAALSGYGTATGTVISTDLERPWPRLAGVSDAGSILVFQGRRSDGTSRRLHAYDPETLRPAPHHDVRLPGRASWAWADDGHLLWIDETGRLRVDGAAVEGRFRWARTP